MADNDRLLHLLTARERVGVSMLREVIAQLTTELNGDISSDGLRTYKLCRALDMLGHCEHQRERPGWLSIASPCLCRLPMAGKERYVLAGARSPTTTADIRAAAESANVRIVISESPQRSPEPLLPQRIVIEFEAADCREKFAQALSLPCPAVPPAWALVCFSQGIQDFEAALEWHPRNATIRGIQIFDATKQAFVDSADAPEVPFVCRMTSDPSQYFAVAEREEARVIDIDWGRQWALAKAGVSPILYDRKKRLLAAPSFLPLPRLLARALCLCSGAMPLSIILRRDQERSYAVFREVPPEISDMAAQKLGTSFVPESIDALDQLPS